LNHPSELAGIGITVALYYGHAPPTVSSRVSRDGLWLVAILLGLFR
jgi:hypothetical protein